MIRIPDSKPNHLALMVKVTESKIKNFLIKRTDGGFKLNTMWAQTMEDLIEQLSSATQSVLPVPLLPGFFLKKDVAERKSKTSQGARQRSQQQGTRPACFHSSATSTSTAAASSSSAGLSATATTTTTSSPSSSATTSAFSDGLGRKRNAIDVSPRRETARKKLRRPPSSPAATAAPMPAAPTVAMAAAAALAAADDLAAAAAACTDNISDNVETAESEEAAAIATMLARHNATLNGTLLSQSAAQYTAAPASAAVTGGKQNDDEVEQDGNADVTMTNNGNNHGSTASTTANTNDFAVAASNAASDEIMVEEDAVVLNPPHMHAAAHGYTAMHVDELTFAQGDTVAVVEKPEGGWWKGAVEGRTGWFPANHAAPSTVVVAAGAGAGAGAAGGGLSAAAPVLTTSVSDQMLLAPPVGLSGIKVRGSMTMLLPPPPGFDADVESTTTDPIIEINGAVTANSEN